MKLLLAVLLIVPVCCSAMDDGNWVPATDMTQSSNDSYSVTQDAPSSSYDQTWTGTSDSSYDNCAGAEVKQD